MCVNEKGGENRGREMEGERERWSARKYKRMRGERSREKKLKGIKR